MSWLVPLPRRFVRQLLVLVEHEAWRDPGGTWMVREPIGVRAIKKKAAKPGFNRLAA